MKTLILYFLFLFPLLTQATVVISDLDDTIKMTNVENTARAAYNALFSTKVFEPMPELLRQMDGYVNNIHVLSASPFIFNAQIRKLLRVNNVPYKSFFTRSLKDLKDKKRYKKNVIAQVSLGEDTVILMGDNVEIDAEIYLEAKQENPDKEFVIYIHKVRNTNPAPQVFTYFTAFDIAVNEFNHKRMNYYEVMAIANKLLQQRNLDNVISSFSYCPTESKEFSYEVPLTLKPVAALVQTKLIKYCQQRNQR